MTVAIDTESHEELKRQLAQVEADGQEMQNEIMWLRSSLVSLLTLAEANPSPLTNVQVAAICRMTLSGPTKAALIHQERE